MKKLITIFVLLLCNIVFSQTVWEKVQDEHIFGIYSLAFAPKFNFTPYQYIFAGTDGEGILISTDNGNTWIQSVSLLTSFPNATRVHSIVVDNSGNVFIGALGSGIYTSSLGAGQWSAKNDGLTDNNIQSLAIGSSDYLFAGTNSGIFISTNNGNNWTSTSFPNYTVTSLAISSLGYVYASTLSHYIYFSSDNGNNWMPLNSLPLTGRCFV